MIPDFACLSEERQAIFIDKLRDTPQLLKWLVGNDTFHLDPTLNKVAIYQRITNEKTIKNILVSHPAFLELTTEIFITNINKIGINLEILSDAEINCILKAPYTRLPFPKDWLQSFVEDTSSEMQTIHAKLLADHQETFGFLFKTLSSKFHFDIHLHIKNNQLNIEESNKYLLKMLNQDWGNNQFNIMEFIPPVTHYIQDWFKPLLFSLKKYMNEMLSAHVFYRLLGISSDNIILGSSFETPGLPIINVFDYYNYHINRKSIHSVMSVWQALFKPLRPFFYEYVELAQSEENIIMICIRAFMPFIIMSMVLALGYAAILPLAYHLLIEYIFFIPALYFSIVVASQYIQIKNYMYLNFIEWFYGSVYATSQYEPSQKLIHGMKSKDLAHDITDYYVLCLEQCDSIERSYQKSTNSLNNHQILNRKENLEFREQLLNEWQDLKFSGVEPEHMFQIVTSRLQDDKKETNTTIMQLYSIYCNLPENQKAPFKSAYLSLKEKLEIIENLEQQLKNSYKLDETHDITDRFPFQMV